MTPLWIKAFLLHAPLIGLGLGLTAGLCLLAGMSLSVILDPNANNPDTAAIESDRSESEKNSVTGSSADPTVKSSESQSSESQSSESQSSESQSSESQSSESRSAQSSAESLSSESQTIVTPDGIRIVVPAEQIFVEDLSDTSSTQASKNQAPKTQPTIEQPTASLGLQRTVPPQASRLLIVLWSLGGICLVGAGISAWFSRRWNAPESIVSPIVSPGVAPVSAPLGTLALRDPSTIVPVSSNPNLSTLHQGEPETIAPHSLPADPSRPFYGTLFLPEAPESSPFTIEYDPISDAPDLALDDRPKERVLDSDGDNTPLIPPDLITSDLATPDLASLMDIRKRRPRID